MVDGNMDESKNKEDQSNVNLKMFVADTGIEHDGKESNETDIPERDEIVDSIDICAAVPKKRKAISPESATKHRKSIDIENKRIKFLEKKFRVANIEKYESGCNNEKVTSAEDVETTRSVQHLENDLRWLVPQNTQTPNSTGTAYKTNTYKNLESKGSGINSTIYINRKDEGMPNEEQENSFTHDDHNLLQTHGKKSESHYDTPECTEVEISCKDFPSLEMLLTLKEANKLKLFLNMLKTMKFPKGSVDEADRNKYINIGNYILYTNKEFASNNKNFNIVTDNDYEALMKNNFCLPKRASNNNSSLVTVPIGSLNASHIHEEQSPSLSQNIHIFQDREASSIHDQSVRNKLEFNTMIEKGEGLKYKPWPHKLPEHCGVKKDNRYQKRFYKLKREGNLHTLLKEYSVHQDHDYTEYKI